MVRSHRTDPPGAIVQPLGGQSSPLFNKQVPERGGAFPPYKIPIPVREDRVPQKLTILVCGIPRLSAEPDNLGLVSGCRTVLEPQKIDQSPAQDSCDHEN